MPEEMNTARQTARAQPAHGRWPAVFLISWAGCQGPQHSVMSRGVRSVLSAMSFSILPLTTFLLAKRRTSKQTAVGLILSERNCSLCFCIKLMCAMFFSNKMLLFFLFFFFKLEEKNIVYYHQSCSQGAVQYAILFIDVKYHVSIHIVNLIYAENLNIAKTICT